ncbi:MAG: hypothetical protein AAF999_03540 [Pseudomonadota bacterium]
MKAKTLLGIGAIAVIGVISFVLDKPAKSGTASVHCELPVSLAGDFVDLEQASMAPCVVTSEIFAQRRYYWFITFTTRVEQPQLQRPAKEMFAHLSSGATRFPSELASYCANAMSEYFQNNENYIRDLAEREDVENFTVTCTKEAQV